MMANPEISSTQEQGLAAVPPQGRPIDAAEPAGTPSAPKPDVARRRSDSDSGSGAAADRASASAPAPTKSHDPDVERMPLLARVLLGDLAAAVIGLVVLFVIEVQRFGDASLHLRREAWAEDLAVLFGVSVLFGGITALLVRARHTRVAIVQAVVTALVLAAAVTSAATGDPKATPDTTTTVPATGNPG